MTEQPPSWSNLEKPAHVQTEDVFAKLCVQVFTTPSGKALLAELRRRHVDRSMHPLADERALRVLATEQHFVRELELACERGLKSQT